MGAFEIEVWGATDVGKSRHENQDSIYVATPELAQVGVTQLRRNGVLLAVADGVGGQIGGREASQFVVESLADGFYGILAHDVETHLLQAIWRANEQAQQQVTSKHAASTLVAAVIQDDYLQIANVGDSRAYFVREGSIQQLTQDHAIDGRLMRYMVAHQAADPELSPKIPLEVGDKVLLCSDGLYKAVDDVREIGRIVTEQTPQSATETLIDLANENGGPDNISVVIAEVRSKNSSFSFSKINNWMSNLLSL